MRARRLRLWVVVEGVILVFMGVMFFIVPPRVLPSPSGLFWFYPLIGGCFIAMGVMLLMSAVFATTTTRKPLLRVAELGTTRSPDEVLRVVNAYVMEATGVRAERTGDTVSAQFGSQLAMRLMGVLTRYGLDRIPYRLNAEAHRTKDGTALTLSFRSDEGWYLARGAMVDRAYDARFTYVAAVLASRLEPTGSRPSPNVPAS